MDRLYVVMPAYNEEENIISVTKEWHAAVEKINKESRLVIIDDGSKDNTYPLLKSLEKELPQLIAITKPNGGHGATIRFGYQYALDNGADYIFQTDSDGQTLASEFPPFWEQRQNFSVILGNRSHRKDGLSRVFTAKILKFVLWCIFGLRITDANVPFRLMKREALARYIPHIPQDFNLTNVLLTVNFVKYEACKFMPITFRPRQGGTNSINFRKIIKIGSQAVKDFRQIKKNAKQEAYMTIPSPK